jgi:predicted negative regulator of RcsB-dependent stress response
MKPESIRNIIIIVIIGAAIVLGIGLFIKHKGTPGTIKMGEKESNSAWYKKVDKMIKDGNAQSALSEIDKKLAQFPVKDPGLEYALYELQGDANKSLKKCPEAKVSYTKSLSSLSVANRKMIFRDEKENKDDDLVFKNEEKKTLKEGIQKKLDEMKAVCP